jgi:glyoxylase-like metal-dependent hydrolase (beta-lactamase superfamily II)
MKELALGRIRVTRVVESEGPTSPRYLLPDATREALMPHHGWLAPHFYNPETDKMNMSVHSFIVRTPHHTILVDTCIGNDKRRTAPHWNMRSGPFVADLAKAGVQPEEVDLVVCTHLHVDHVGWNTRLEDGRWVPTFPNARYIMAETEYEHWRQSHEGDAQEIMRDSVMPIVEAGKALLVASDYAIEDGLRLEPTPGHTPGHCSVHLISGGKEGVITGDLAHHPVQYFENTWVARPSRDREQDMRTRRKFCETYADRDVLILGTHFAFPTVGRIVQAGDSFKFKV